jgi:integrase
MSEPEVSAFLTWLATKRDVAAATQNQALNALVFLYRHVIKVPLGDIENISRVRRPPKLPVVLSHSEAMAVIDRLPAPHNLIVSLIYPATRFAIALQLSYCSVAIFTPFRNYWATVI